MVFDIIAGIISKNLIGFTSKKGSGKWDPAKGLEDVAYGVCAAVTVYGAKALFNIDLTPDMATSTPVYLGLIWLWDRIVHVAHKKFVEKDKDFHLMS